MNRFPFIAVLALAALGAEEPIGPVPQPTPAPAPEVVGAWMSGEFGFDWPGVAENGEVLTGAVVNRVVYIFFDRGLVDPQPRHFVGYDQTLSAGVTRVSFNDALRGVPEGDWDMTVQIRTDAGIWSAISNKLWVRIVPPPTQQRPAPAQNLRRLPPEEP